MNPASSDEPMSGTAGSSCFLLSPSACSVRLSAGVSSTWPLDMVSGLGACILEKRRIQITNRLQKSYERFGMN